MCPDDCNKCCINLRCRIENIPKGKEILDGFDRQYKIFTLYSIESSTIFISGFEREKIEKISNEIGLNPKIFPFKAGLEKGRKRVVVLGWMLDEDNCPFYDSKIHCLIHGHHPLVCRTFPLIPKEPSGIDLSTDCPHGVYTREVSSRMLADMYGNTFAYFIIANLMKIYQQNAFDHLIDTKQLEFRKIQSRMAMKNLIERYDMIDIFDLLIEFGFYSETNYNTFKELIDKINVDNLSNIIIEIQKLLEFTVPQEFINEYFSID